MQKTESEKQACLSLGSKAKMLQYPLYSEVPNNRAALLLDFEKNFRNYTLISTYTFISFQENFLPTPLIAPTL